MDETSVTEATARRYFDAWTSRDTQAAASLLAPDFTFTAGDMAIEGRAAFLDAAAFPRDAAATMIAEAYQHAVAFQMYDATRGPHTVRIVEQLSVAMPDQEFHVRGRHVRIPGVQCVMLSGGWETQ